MNASYDLLIGIDWATGHHQACVLDAEGVVVDEKQVEHAAGAIHSFAESVLGRVDGSAGQVAIAIEVPRGALVETLIERGFHVYVMNPKQVDRFRDRHTVAGAKDDRRDAYVLADALRTDLQAFRRVSVDDPLVIRIRELSRADEDLREEYNRLTNRLREQLYRCAAHLLPLVPAADEPWFWDLVEQVICSDRRPTPARITKLLRAHRIRRYDARQVLDVVRQKPLWCAPGAVDAAREHIELLLPRLRMVHEQRTGCARRLRELLEEYAAEEDGDIGEDPGDLAIITSVPGVGPRVCAGLIAEAAHLIRRREADGLRALAGLAPVTRQSGTRRVVCMRRACNHRLRTAFYHWARVSVQHDDAARNYYANLRTRGHSHGRALRAVADRWIRILIAMLNDRTLYDPHQQKPTNVAA
jgi:transposase